MTAPKRKTLPPPEVLYVMGVDPGGTTGIAVVRFHLDPPKVVNIWSDQLPWDDACDAIELWSGRLVVYAKDPGVQAMCGAERFMINAKTFLMGQDPIEDTMYMNGVVKRTCNRRGLRLEWQNSSAPLAMVDNRALQTLGLFGRGFVHQNDASRHAVFHAIRRRVLDARLLLLEPG
jgi:hypothetical protein